MSCGGRGVGGQVQVDVLLLGVVPAVGEGEAVDAPGVSLYTESSPSVRAVLSRSRVRYG